MDIRHSLSSVNACEPSQFDQMNCLLAGGFSAFGEEDLCSSVVEQVLSFYDDDRHRLVDGEEDDSSGTTGSRSRPGRDRARTLVSERRRRGRMKEKLYELRSLVPNITKMDKASIIGDAILYVKNLQKRVQILSEEIASLENSSKEETKLESLPQMKQETPASGVSLSRGEMLDFSVSDLGSKRFQLRMTCSKGDVATSALYGAMDMLTFARQESSSLSTFAGRPELCMTMKVEGCDGEMDAAALKLWAMTALLEAGFKFHAATAI